MVNTDVSVKNKNDAGLDEAYMIRNSARLLLGENGDWSGSTLVVFANTLSTQ